MTLGEIAASTDWVWVYCEHIGCGHRAPMKLATAIARFGEEASGDVLRQRARCAKCGQFGSAIKTPSYNAMSQAQPFPEPRDDSQPDSTSG